MCCQNLVCCEFQFTSALRNHDSFGELVLNNYLVLKFMGKGSDRLDLSNNGVLNSLLYAVNFDDRFMIHDSRIFSPI